MRFSTSAHLFRILILALTAAPIALAGCGAGLEQVAATAAASTTEPVLAPAAIPGKTINGNVHGGVYPIKNATIRLMETQVSSTSTYPKSTDPSVTTQTAAKQLLTTTSDGNGNFTFADTGWSCDSGQYAYITVSSGYTVNLNTTTFNNDVVQVGVIGPCTLLANKSEIDSVNVFVSELSTVAAAYALGNFIWIDNTNASSGEQLVNITAPQNNSSTGGCTVTSGTTAVCTAAGLAHAFTLASVLVDSVETNGTFPTGQAQFSNKLSTISSIPAPLINTMGNILQKCVDSIGGSQCSSLFSYATPTGGTAPTNTLQVAMNMAKNPTSNVTNLYNLQAPAVPFTPSLGSAPPSFALSVFYGVTASGSAVPYPVDIALDSSDDAFILYADNAPGYATYSAEAAIFPSGQGPNFSAHNTAYKYPSQIAVDGNGYVFSTNNDPTAANGAVLELSNSALYPTATLPNASGIAIDRGNNVWVSEASATGPSMNEFTSAAMRTALSTNGSTYASAPVALSSKALGSVLGLAVDSGQNIWGAGANSTGNAMAAFLANSGGKSTATYTSGGGTTQAFSTTAPFSVAPGAVTVTAGVTTAYNVFMPLYNQLSSASYATAGGTLSVGSSSAASTAAVPHRSQVDGAGSVFWTDLEGAGQLYRYTPPAAGSAMSTGTVVAILPCFAYPTGSTFNCVTTSNATATTSVYTPANFRALAIDSAGNIWYAADAGYGAIIETIGTAAPTWPLIAYGHPAALPK